MSHPSGMLALIPAARGRAEGRLRGMLELRFGRAGAEASEQVLDQLSRRSDPARLIAGAGSFEELAAQLAN